MSTRSKCIAVLLITRDRADYTRRTLDAWREQNDGNAMHRFELLHVDDASLDSENFRLAGAAGFETIATHDQPYGVTASIRRAANRAAQLQIPNCLILENDWTAVRPFPWELFDYFTQVPVAYCLRLTGRWKEQDENGKGRRPFGTDHAGRGKKEVLWCPLMDAPEPCEMGSIHFGNPPAVTRTSTLRWLLEGSDSEAAVRLKSGKLVVGNDYTIRPTCGEYESPVFLHIGAERTPGFKR